MRRLRSERGYSLVEMLTVLVILGGVCAVIFGVLAPMINLIQKLT